MGSKIRWKPKYTIFILLAFLGFMARELGLMRQEIGILGTEKGIVFAAGSGFLLLGEPSVVTDWWIASHQPYFHRFNVFKTSDLEPGKPLDFGDFTAQYFSDSLVYIQTINGTEFFWLGEDSMPDFSQITVDLEVDFLVINTPQMSSNWPIPRKGIIYVRSSRVPQNIKDWSIEHRVPLIVPALDGDFELKREDGGWKVSN